MLKTKLIPISAIFLFLIVSTFAYPYTSQMTDESLKSFQLGSNTIEINQLAFTCTNTFCDGYQVRTAPEGTYSGTCECSGYNDYENYCYAWKMKNVIQNDNEPSCWKLSGSFLNKPSLIYGEETEIAPYIKAKYTTDASFTNKFTGKYNIEVTIDVNVKDGLKLSLGNDPIIAQGEAISITYDNQIINGLKGFIEIKELNSIFFVFSRVEKIPFTINKGTGQIHFTLDKVTGNKEIIVTPVVEMKELPSNKIITFTGTESSTISKVALQHETDISDTVLYNLPNQINGETTTNKLSWIARFNLWVENLFA